MRQFLFLSAVVFVLPLLACGGNESRVGESCDDGSTCEEGLMCRPDFPGTVCTQSCIVGGEQAGCPDGTLCIREFTDDLLCAPTCDGDGDCREGYRCTEGACRVNI